MAMGFKILSNIGATGGAMGIGRRFLGSIESTGDTEREKANVLCRQLVEDKADPTTGDPESPTRAVATLKTRFPKMATGD